MGPFQNSHSWGLSPSKLEGLAWEPVFSRMQVGFPAALPTGPASLSLTSCFAGGGVVTSQSCASLLYREVTQPHPYTDPSLLDSPIWVTREQRLITSGYFRRRVFLLEQER